MVFAPLLTHKLERHLRILGRRVANCGATRLDDPPQMLRDEIAQREPERQAPRMGKKLARVDNVGVHNTQRIKVVL